MKAVLETMEKTELHQHLGGSIPPSLTWQLLQARGLAPVDSFEALRPLLVLQPDEVGSPSAYFRKFQHTLWATQYADALEQSAEAVAREAFRLGVTTLELRFSAQLHTYAGLSVTEALLSVLKGLDCALTEFPGHRAGLIASAVRQLGPAVAERLAAEVVEVASRSRGKDQASLVGFDLSGAERYHPARLFARAFALAKSGGLALTAHAGEEDEPRSIWEAIDVLGVARIGHGCSALKDQALLRRLERDRILVECCTTSNWHTGAVEAQSIPVLVAFLDTGIPVALCTDNPTVSGTNSVLESERLMRHMTLSEIEDVHRSARAHSFLERRGG